MDSRHENCAVEVLVVNPPCVHFNAVGLLQRDPSKTEFLSFTLHDKVLTFTPASGTYHYTLLIVCAVEVAAPHALSVGFFLGPLPSILLRKGFQNQPTNTAKRPLMTMVGQVVEHRGNDPRCFSYVQSRRPPHAVPCPI
jgi:hypothetical protein